MKIQKALMEARKVILKIDKEIPAELLKKINSTGLQGEELYNLKKTVLMQLKSKGTDEKELMKFIDKYMGLVNYSHKHNYSL